MIATEHDEQNIPIDYTQHEFQFTRGWFKVRNQKTFSQFLLPKFDGTKPINMLQIGVFEGMDLVWSMQNLARHPDSRVVAMDPWAQTTKIEAAEMERVRLRALHNLSPWKDKVRIQIGMSQVLLAKVPDHHTFDLCIIDGDHNAPAVYQDLNHCYRLTKPGGWLMLDDVENKIEKKDHVKQGLAKWLADNPGKIKQVWKHRYCECFEKL